MNIQVIHEHSVDIDLLSGGICIDAGCRGFLFSEAMRDLGLKVLSFDLEDMQAPAGVLFQKGAVGHETKMVFYKDTADAQAKFITDFGIGVMQWSLNDLYKGMHNEVIDVLKLDIEGSEYPILSDPNFQPIPKQISVEFHEHAHKELHDKYFTACMANLERYYVTVKHDRYKAHGCGFNWWDSLFIRRDLIQK
jgi:hypothetical protein